MVLSDLCSVVAPRIGSSSAGEFTEESVETGSVAVGLIASDDIRFAGSDCPDMKADPELAVRTVANRFPVEMEGFLNLSAILLIDGVVRRGGGTTALASAIFNQTLGRNVKLAGAIIFDCACRVILGDEFSMGVDQFKDVLGDILTLGWATCGEICIDQGQFVGFHNTTSAVLPNRSGGAKQI